MKIKKLKLKIFLATDHTGLEIKDSAKSYLEKEGYEVVDCGAYEYDKDDDYPDFMAKAARGVSENPGSYGFIFGGSGQGEQMTANKIPGIRCALFYAKAIPEEAADISGRESHDPFEIIRLTREHNDANMLSFGSRFLKKEDILKAIEIFLNTSFSTEERHKRRVEKIKKVEGGC